MDSGNSASLQSSSGGVDGGDQEFDSRPGKSYPAFPNNHVSFANNFDNLIDHNNPFYNNHNHNNNNFNSPPTFSQSSSNNNNNSINNNNFCGDNNNNNDILGMVWPNKYSSAKQVDDPRNCTNTAGPAARYSSVAIPSSKALPGCSDHRGPGEGGRNPKKRARASRRAPTTVLTTDTNNFRQMVQEFTGIPAPPFSGRTRLDLFGGSGIQFPRGSIGGGGGGGGGGLFDVSSLGMQSSTPPPYYLLRSFPQKVVPNATGSLIIEPGALGPAANAAAAVTNVTSTAVAATNNMAAAASIDSGNNAIMNALNNNQERIPLQRQSNSNCSIDGGGEYGGGVIGSVNGGNATNLGNHGGGGGRSEGMVDYSWICSSD